MSRGASGWAHFSGLVAKDLVLEARGRQVVAPMLAFTLSVVTLLAFALPGAARPTAVEALPAGAVPAAEILAGFLWVSLAFAGLVGFARSFEVDRHDGAMEALLASPVDRSIVFAAKAASNLGLLMIAEIILLPLFWIFFSIDVGATWPALVAVVVLTDIAFVAVGTLTSVVAAATRSRELLLPVLALPLLVPAFVASVELCGDAFSGAALSSVAARGWFGLLIAYDIVFGIVGALVFDFALDR